MFNSAQLFICTNAQIGMPCCNFEWSTVHFMSCQQVIPFMHDIAFINFKFHLLFGFPVTESVYVLFVVNDNHLIY